MKYSIVFHKGSTLFYNKFDHKHNDYFPSGWVYSYNYGYIWPSDIEEKKFRDQPLVCLYDSMERPQDVKL